MWKNECRDRIIEWWYWRWTKKKSNSISLFNSIQFIQYEFDLSVCVCVFMCEEVRLGCVSLDECYTGKKMMIMKWNEILT